MSDARPTTSTSADDPEASLLMPLDLAPGSVVDEVQTSGGHSSPSAEVTGSGKAERDHPMPLHAAPAALHPQEDHGFKAILGNRDFRFLWGAQVTSQLADKFVMYTVLLYVSTLSALALFPSLVMIAYTFPSVLLSAPAGVYADRHDKGRLMLICNVVRAVLILTIPLSGHIPALHDQIWVPILVTFLFSSAGQVFAPSEAASIPSLVEREQITSATSLFITTVLITLVAGVPAATLAARFFGNEVPFYVATGLFVAAGVSVAQIRTNLRAKDLVDADSDDHSGLLFELREGLKILGRSAALRLALMELTLALVIVFTLFALGPAYMTKDLRLSNDDMYIVLIPAMLGMILVGGMLGQAGKKVSRARLLVRAVVTAGVTLVIISAASVVLRSIHLDGAVVPLVVLTAFVFGCALGWLFIPAFTVLQERTTEESRGRIFGGIFTVINAAAAVPLLLAGVLADVFSVGAVFGTFGAILIVVGIVLRLRFFGALAVLEEDAG